MHKKDYGVLENMMGYYTRSGSKFPFATRAVNRYRRFRQQNKPYYPAVFFVLDITLSGLKVLPVAVAFVIIYSQIS